MGAAHDPWLDDSTPGTGRYAFDRLTAEERETVRRSQLSSHPHVLPLLAIIAHLSAILGHPDHGRLAKAADRARQARVTKRAGALMANGMGAVAAYELAYREADSDG